MSAVLETKNSFPTNVIERVILNGISWKTYQRILDENNEVSNTHFSYCNGDLEIMVLVYEHETLKARLSELIIEIARILKVDYECAASTTFRKESKQKGFEGDATFYFKDVQLVRAKKVIDLTVDPPPELVVEIDITHGSLPKFPIFSDLGIEEVWRFDGEVVEFYRLNKNHYKKIEESVCLPKVSSRTVTNLLFAANEMNRFDWVELIHEAIKKD